jgi:glutamine amidotransferase
LNNPSTIPDVAIVDYGLGNLFSIQQACRHAGLDATITSSNRQIQRAESIILPGVGAFGDAMAALKRLDLITSLRDAACSGKPLMGICLGLQLLFSTSNEFGKHRGLDIIPGSVQQLNSERYQNRQLKVPQVGWNRIMKPEKKVSTASIDSSLSEWSETILNGIKPGSFMYFVHSYFVVPEDVSTTLTLTDYGDIRFCSGIKRNHIYGFQFHPERSGKNGLKIYENLKKIIYKNRSGY